ncbi:hypothetical protein ACIRPU_11450 [Streptomyces sp. NPDC102259]|uniref:hypothetical protein n=1 Tax=Streptomyces sp. NPDC102259 TaxID=3366148 RepID=UPI0038119AE2
MTRTVFGEISFFWFWWTLYEAVLILAPWTSRTRVLGARLQRVPGVMRIRRRATERRVGQVLAHLERVGVPVRDTPDPDQLVDRWHRMGVGRAAGVLLQAVPLMVVVVSMCRMTPAGGASVVPLWMFASFAAFGVLSIGLMVLDDRAVSVSDAAGGVTSKAVLFLEALLVREERRTEQSALDTHGGAFDLLCRALRAQARHETRKMASEVREQARQDTERLVAALTEYHRRVLFGEGTEKEAVVRDLAHLVSSTLRYSCRPRVRLDGLVIVAPALLADTPVPEASATAGEPPRTRIARAAGRLAVAAGLLAAAALFPGAGAATELLTAAGLVSLALVCPPLREALERVRELLSREPPADPGCEQPAPPPPCPHCAARSAVTAGSRPVR